MSEQGDPRDHSECYDEVSAANLFVEAAPDDRYRQGKAKNSKHHCDGRNNAPRCGYRLQLPAADLCQHGRRPPHRLRHIAETVGLNVAFDNVHGRCGRHHDAAENNNAGQ